MGPDNKEEVGVLWRGRGSQVSFGAWLALLELQELSEGLADASAGVDLRQSWPSMWWVSPNTDTSVSSRCFVFSHWVLESQPGAEKPVR